MIGDCKSDRKIANYFTDHDQDRKNFKDRRNELIALNLVIAYKPDYYYFFDNSKSLLKRVPYLTDSARKEMQLNGEPLHETLIDIAGIAKGSRECFDSQNCLTHTGRRTNPAM